MTPLRIGIVGFGKIARDQHVPAITRLPRFAQAATVSRGGGGIEGVPCYTSHGEMIERERLDAVAICTPPGARYDIARDCIAAGLHVLLEKPPAATLAEIEDLVCLAEAQEISLFATWHARFNPAVADAAKALAGQRIAAMDVTWHEDVRKWHPGQQWIWDPAGFGVFDPGINALSIVTAIFPGALFVRSAALLHPANRQAAIAAELEFHSPASSGPLKASFDWRREEGEAWTISIRTEAGQAIKLSDGGARLAIDGTTVEGTGPGEYPAIYERFLDLIDERRGDVDVRPLRLVADALLVGTRTATDPFTE